MYIIFSYISTMNIPKIEEYTYCINTDNCSMIKIDTFYPCVYVISLGNKDYNTFKIGRTCYPNEKLKMLSTLLGSDLEFCMIFELTNICFESQIQAYMHTHLYKYLNPRSRFECNEVYTVPFIRIKYCLDDLEKHGLGEIVYP